MRAASMVRILATVVFVPVLCASVQAQGLVTPEFTYQGRLMDAGVVANGIYDMEFKLFDSPSAGTQVGFTQTGANIGIIDGIVTIELNFGFDAFPGQARWLEIGIRPGASIGAYTVLTPRQSLTASPYAMFAARPVPSGAVMYFNLQTCPPGWSELTAARGRYPVGLQPGGTLAAVMGTALSNLENRPVGRHAHTAADTGHTHGYEQAFPNSTSSGNSQAGYRHADTDVGFARIRVDSTGTTNGTNAPYIILLICQKD